MMKFKKILKTTIALLLTINAAQISNMSTSLLANTAEKDVSSKQSGGPQNTVYLLKYEVDDSKGEFWDNPVRDFNLGAGQPFPVLSDPVFFGQGMEFAGWAESPDKTGKFWDTKTELMPERNLTLYPVFRPVLRDLTYDVDGANGGNYTVKTAEWKLIKRPENPVKQGHTFLRWTYINNIGAVQAWNFDVDEMIADAMTLRAEYQINQYTVSFDIATNGGNGVAPAASTKNFGALITAPENPIKTGQTFLGWNTTANGNGRNWNFSTDGVPAENITLYAQFSSGGGETLYTVTYDITTNGGSGIVPETSSHVAGTVLTAPESPTKTGSRFVGWNTAANGSGTTWNFGTSTIPAMNITLYAQYSINEYALTFDINGGDSVAPAALRQ
ncbi:MAG: InlB B-repeat-containing protein, partial [Culicoidibacterales bacterium]